MDGKQLKNSILQWAIQGKLVPQNPKDEPASKLLERIAESRNESSLSLPKGTAKGTKSKDLKKKTSKNLPSRIYCENGVWYEQVGTATPKDISDEIPFEIPENWAWCRLGDLGVYRKGPFGSSLTKSMFVPKSDETIKVYEQKNAIKKDYTLGDYYISQKKFNTMQSFIVRPNDIIVSCAGTIGETYMLPLDAPIGIINQALMRVCLYDLEIADYWQLFFEYILLKKAEMKGAGSAIKNIPPFEILKSLLIALPPIQEQKRLLGRYRELLKHIEEYDDAQEQLDKLNKELPEALKKSILQEAIQGKLVPQNPKDEPASVLLAKIRKEKEALVKQGKLKKKDLETIPIDDEEIPFEIPESWTWCRIGDIFTLQAGKNIASSEIHNSISKQYQYPCYGGNGKRGFVSTYNRKGHYCLIGRQGALCGNINYADGLFYATEHAVVVEVYSNVDVSWSGIFLSALNLNQYATATAQPGLAVANINKVLIPLPPLAEQKRIVRKIEELYKVIDSWH